MYIIVYYPTGITIQEGRTHGWGGGSTLCFGTARVFIFLFENWETERHKCENVLNTLGYSLRRGVFLRHNDSIHFGDISEFIGLDEIFGIGWNFVFLIEIDAEIFDSWGNRHLCRIDNSYLIFLVVFESYALWTIPITVNVWDSLQVEFVWIQLRYAYAPGWSTSVCWNTAFGTSRYNSP